MNRQHYVKDVKRIAAEFNADIHALEVLNTPNARAVRRTYSCRLKHAQPEYVLEFARVLLEKYDHRWAAYELIQNHETKIIVNEKL